jgi:succinate dehydrogenase/fumarate reductase flavoprotein subunit
MVAAEQVTDLLVVGAGAAGLVAALVARESGLDVLVVEKTDKVGGSSALSGGGLWIPDNPLMRAAGVHDSAEEALTYLEGIVGDVGPASSRERKEAFLRAGPVMITFLQGLGVRLIYAEGYPDYYPERPGGNARGRCVEAGLIDGRTLGAWGERLRTRAGPPVAIHSGELSRIVLAARTVSGLRTAVRAIGVRTIGRSLLRQKPMVMGGSLMGQLLTLALARQVDIWLDSPLTELDVDSGAVVGALVDRAGQPVRVRARRGVMLAAGGFARNAQMRQAYQQHPITADWTMAAPGDTGDAVRAGMAVGAATALLDDAWWAPSVLLPDGTPYVVLADRALPGSIMVDSSGERFTNEAASYVDCCHDQYRRHTQVPAIPAWMVFDRRHRRRYPLAVFRPGVTPKSALESGFLRRAMTVETLAAQCGIDADGLRRTVQRFNGFASTGRDQDFGRGDSAYDRFYGDPRVRPNPNLGPLDRPPFYAVQIWPGDLGTKGGLLTDEHARVLREDGTPIPALYAAGNTTASVMGRTYAGPGATLGPAATFAYLGARHITQEPQP